MKTRMTVDLSTAQAERLARLADKLDQSKADTIRHALRVFEYILEHQEQGYPLVLVRQGEPNRNIVLI